MTAVDAQAARFWPKVNQAGPLPLRRGVIGNCWLWTGTRKTRGYGQFRVGRVMVATHRWSYERLAGPIPTGLELDHLCRNTACCNPAHLEPVTCIENIRRRFALMTHCPRGHTLSGDNLRYQHGRRRCRTCQRHSNRASEARKRLTGAEGGNGGLTGLAPRRRRAS